MIIDTLARADWYLAINSRIARAFRYLQQTDLAALAAGTYLIDDRRVYAIVQEYETRAESDAQYESHRRYLDIQYVISGHERIGWANRDLLAPGTYDEEKDLEFHAGTGQLLDVPMGSFMLLAPHDAHLPCVHPLTGRTRVKKVVVKVLVRDD